MNIKQKTKTGKKNFEDIETGECFITSDDYGDECTYMKTATVIDEDGDTLNAIDICFGTLATFKDDDEVESVDAIVTIERYRY